MTTIHFASSTTHAKCNEVSNRTANISQHLDETLSADVRSHVISHVTRVREREYKQTKYRHVEKLDRLLAKKKNVAKDIDLSGEQLKNG